jgi:hypothetical protein
MAPDPFVFSARALLSVAIGGNERWFAYSTVAKTGMDFCEGARMLQYAGTLPMRPQGYAGRSGMIIREVGLMFRTDPRSAA